MSDVVSRKTAKQTYFEKKLENADIIPCSCGCGELIKSVDKYGRAKQFISGHNARKFTGAGSSQAAATKRWAKSHPEKIRDGKRIYYRRRKLRAMAHLGNKCAHCSIEYNGKNSPIFEFHHKDPETKDVGVTRIVANATWETVLLELDKCELVCANCHNQFHGGEW